MTRVHFLPRKALMRPLDSSNPDPFYADLEKEMLEKINELGIGPQGFGGKTTAIGLNIETMPTHIGRYAVCSQYQLPCDTPQIGGDINGKKDYITTHRGHLLRLLHAGDQVLLTGTIYTSRDAGHKRMCEALAKGEKIPFDPTDATIYYVGTDSGEPGTCYRKRRPDDQRTYGRLCTDHDVCGSKGNDR